MSRTDPEVPPELSERVARLERQIRVLRLGAVFLFVGVVVAATAAFRAPASPQDISARAITFVDSTGAPTASIGWEDGAIRMVTPLEMPEDQEFKVPLEEDSATVQIVDRRRTSWGAQLILRPGDVGPGLYLADGDGRVHVRLSAPRVGPADDR
ncbi:MAG: hypothetical protein ACOC5J_03515 [Gemmatimonadota bacterium]